MLISPLPGISLLRACGDGTEGKRFVYRSRLTFGFVYLTCIYIIDLLLKVINYFEIDSVVSLL